MRIASLALWVALSMCAGCARYEYDLVQPADLARHIGAAEQVLSVPPLEYRLQSYDNRLVMRIFNSTSDAVALVGSRSTVVDPAGQSHPIAGQTMAPSSFIKLIFPPLVPRFEHRSPMIGIGIGYRSRAHAPAEAPLAHAQVQPAPAEAQRAQAKPQTAASTRPLYLDDAPLPGSAYYWDWDGQTDVRVLLTFEHVGRQFTHEWTFARRKQ